MHYSKKSLSLLSVATIALFASLSQNSIAASNVDSGVSSTSSRPLLEANPYVTTRLIDPAKFSPEIRAKFDRLKAADPYMYDQVMNVANYGVPEDDVLKDIKNPRDRIGFSKAVRAANPEFDEGRAAFRANIAKDLANPKTQLGKLGAVTDSLRQADVLDATAFKNLPAGGPSFWNRCIQVPIAKFFNNTPFMVVDAQRWLFVRYLERTLMGGASLPDDIIPDDMGYEGAHRVISGYENALLGKWIASINNVHVASSRRRGIPSDLVPQDILANLVDLGFVSVKHGYVIPEITAQEYEDSLKKRNQ